MTKERPPRAPRNWRRRMGTAVLFLLALEAIILIGPYNQLRTAFAVTVAIAVALAIALIWRRNTRLEGLAGAEEVTREVRLQQGVPRFDAPGEGRFTMKEPLQGRTSTRARLRLRR